MSGISNDPTDLFDPGPTGPINWRKQSALAFAATAGLALVMFIAGGFGPGDAGAVMVVAGLLLFVFGATLSAVLLGVRFERLGHPGGPLVMREDAFPAELSAMRRASARRLHRRVVVPAWTIGGWLMVAGIAAMTWEAALG